jgi:alkyl sulfatase BDS1-like metallo-beta-lactamase superfamily hydrolase
MADPVEEPKDASALTHALNRAVLASLPFDDTQDFEDARRGFELYRVALCELAFADAVERGLVRVEGSAAKVGELFGLLDDFTLMFAVVEPKRASRGAPAPPGS